MRRSCAELVVGGWRERNLELVKRGTAGVPVRGAVRPSLRRPVPFVLPSASVPPSKPCLPALGNGGVGSVAGIRISRCFLFEMVFSPVAPSAGLVRGGSRRFWGNAAFLCGNRCRRLEGVQLGVGETHKRLACTSAERSVRLSVAPARSPFRLCWFRPLNHIVPHWGNGGVGLVGAGTRMGASGGEFVVRRFPPLLVPFFGPPLFLA